MQFYSIQFIAQRSTLSERFISIDSNYTKAVTTEYAFRLSFSVWSRLAGNIYYLIYSMGDYYFENCWFPIQTVIRDVP